MSRARPRQVIVTDIRRHWAQPWITAVVRAGLMDPLVKDEFQPGQRIRRGDVAEIVARALGLIAYEKPEVAKKWAGVRVQVTDVPAGHLSYPAVSVAVASGVMPLDNGGFGRAACRQRRRSVRDCRARSKPCRGHEHAGLHHRKPAHDAAFAVDPVLRGS